MVLGLEKLAITETTCEICIYAKQHKNISCKPVNNAKQKLRQIHINLWGIASNIFL